MIVIGVDVHKHSLTAVAVDEAGRMLDENTVAAADDGFVAWASELSGERLWALEDCRQLTRALERRLLAEGEELVRVPPKLMAPERRAGRLRGKSDPIDALAVARAALREPRLSRPRPDEQPFRELKLLSTTGRISSTSAGGHNNGCAGTCTSSTRHSSFPCAVSTGRCSSIASAAGWHGASRTSRCASLASSSRAAVRSRARSSSSTMTIVELDHELEQRTAETAPALLELPGCGPLTAAKLLAEIGPIGRFQSDAQLARHSGVAPLEASSGRVQRHRLDRGGNRQLNAAFYRIAITQARYHPAARAYLERKQAEGKSRREALRCLKRQLARTVHTTLKNEPLLT